MTVGGCELHGGRLVNLDLLLQNCHLFRESSEATSDTRRVLSEGKRTYPLQLRIVFIPILQVEVDKVGAEVVVPKDLADVFSELFVDPSGLEDVSSGVV